MDKILERRVFTEHGLVRNQSVTQVKGGWIVRLCVMLLRGKDMGARKKKLFHDDVKTSDIEEVFSRQHIFDENDVKNQTYCT